MAKRQSKAMAATLRPARAVMAMATKKAAAKTPAKTPTKATSKRPAQSPTQTTVQAGAEGTVVGTTVTKMPASQTAGATAQGIYLYDNDAWAQRYFDPNDLHSVERELFG